MTWLRQYGDTEGPLGFPMFDAEAKALDSLLREHPDHEYQRLVVEKATADLTSGERADVSWIQTETIDRYAEIVLASGFDDTFFKGNPIVTINHDYYKQPVGRSLWRQRLREGDRRGVKAKTHYPPRPEEWPDSEIWHSDAAWSLVKSGLMGGKSIGFITLKSHSPTEEEVKKRPELAKVRRIVDAWSLLEYACCWLPVNPETVVEATSKALVTAQDLKAFGIEPPIAAKHASGASRGFGGENVPPELVKVIPHTPYDQIEAAVRRALADIDLAGLCERALEQAYLRAQGRV
jgi:phage head maturation protease